MRRDLSKTTSFLILIAITGAIMFAFYGKVLLSPNQYLMSTDGDGVKNYYTFLYHIRHDTSNVHFSGMNYPHGELHLFTDGSHPLSVFLKQFSESPLVKGKEVAWLNLFTLLSVFPCVILIWLILGRLKIANWFAIIGAISITFLAPQWLRMSGHFSLSLLFALPLTIYLLMRFLEGRGKVLWLILSSVIYFLFLIFTHIYLGVLCMFFFLITSFIYFLFSRDKSQLKKRFVGSLIGALVPIALFAIYLLIFDNVSDRPGNPGGVMNYLSGVESVLLPNVGPLNKLASSVFDMSGRSWEGFSYIGILSVLVLFFNLVIFTVSKFKTSTLDNWKPPVPLFLAVSLLSGFVLLLLSFGVFHTILGDHLSFLLGPFRQIRGLGRFAWAFYFPCLIFVFYCLHFWIRKLKNFRSQIVAGILVLLVFTFDWWPFQEYVSEGRDQTTNFLNTSNFSNSENEELASLYDLYKQVNSSEYQAILPLPFYFVGGEYYNAHIKNGILPASVAFSTWSGLPLMSSAMSRTSQSLVKDRLQLLIDPVYRKKDQRSLFTDKDVLILLSNESGPRGYSEWLLSASRSLVKNEYFELRAISPEDFFQEDGKSEVEDQEYQTVATELNDTVDKGPIHWQDFSSLACSSYCLPPGGAFEGKPQSYHKVVTFESGTFEKDTSYTVSFWFYNAFPEKKEFFLIEEIAPDGNVSGWQDILGLDNTPFVWDNWSVIEKEFQVSNSESAVNLVVSNFSSDYPIIIDNVLVRKTNRDIVKEMPDSTILLNNLPLSKRD